MCQRKSSPRSKGPPFTLHCCLGHMISIFLCDRGGCNASKCIPDVWKPEKKNVKVGFVNEIIILC